MDITILPTPLSGDLRAIPSKSYMHRALICAALADRPTVLHCPESNQDIQATTNCLRALGADITEENGIYTVSPLPRDSKAVTALDCGESGSTLRFMLPLAAALGRDAVFAAHGLLPKRPLSPLFEQLQEHGVRLSQKGVFPLSVSGQLQPGQFCLSGGVSSQFFTGLLLALPLLSEISSIQVIGKLESAPYIALTEDVLRRFGVTPDIEADSMKVFPQAFYSPGALDIEGDWSNAAFWLVAGALGDGIRLSGLQPDSRQGDQRIVQFLRKMGAQIREESGFYTISHSHLHGISIDAGDIPDLVPILSVAAAAAEGETVITGAARLRLKESDRIRSVCDMLTALGADCRETADGLCIRGGDLHGGTVDSCNDHRIAMSAAIASIACDGEVTIHGAEAVNKSYPAFFRDFRSAGGKTLSNTTQGH